MKLKILVMPFVFVIVIIVGIWYIYPTWFGEEKESIKNIKTEIAKKEIDLASIRERKQNIINLEKSLENNEQLSDMVINYYPFSRREEDVINNINDIAFREGVFILDLKVDYKKIEVKDDPIRLMALPPIKNIIKVDGVANTMGLEEENQEGGAVVDPNSRVNFIETNLKIYGTYDKIKNFMISLSKVGLLNNIQKFDVVKEEKEVSIEGQEVTGDGLVANVITGFGYTNVSKNKINTLLENNLFNSQEFKLSYIKDNEIMLRDNYQPTEIGETGLVNPFLP